jgi:hypothetical protein
MQELVSNDGERALFLRRLAFSIFRHKTNQIDNFKVMFTPYAGMASFLVIGVSVL